MLEQVRQAEALSARARPAAMQRSALILGACGPTGEALLNLLLGNPLYGVVHAITRLPLPSSTPKLVGHFVADKAPLADAAWPQVDDAYFVIGERHSYYRRDEAYRALTFEDVLPAAQAAQRAGIRRLALVAPVAIYSHSVAFRHSLMNVAEYELFKLGFVALVLVRPAAPEKVGRHRHWGKRLGAFLLGQVGGLMPQTYQPPTSRLVALAAAQALSAPKAGLTVVDADAVHGVTG